MITKLSLDMPDDVMATVTITMRVREWRVLKDKILGGSYASNSLIGSIATVIERAEKTFVSSEEDE